LRTTSSDFICNFATTNKTAMIEVERKQIIALVNREVIPAIGCTEPIAVALAVAKASETLGKCPEKITLYLSANILKNAMGVGIPGTEMIGLPIAVALGALIGKSEYQLEVLRDSTPEALEQGKQMIAEKRINILLKEDISEKLYIEAICEAGAENSKAIISGGHTNFVYVSLGEEVLLNKQQAVQGDETEEEPELSMRKVYDFAMTAPLEEIDFILQTAKINKAAAEKSLKGEYGHALGKTLKGKYEKEIMGDSVFSHILSYTSAACDARMAGAMIPVMSNSGSGNQGIAATLPVVVYAEENKKSIEELTRALMLSHLTVIYIKQSLGRLSALCGCVVAATGSSCGITLLMGGGFEQICFAVKNMIANLTGMICDGAKPSCSLKLTSGVSTAVLSAMMAMENKCVTSVEGIIDNDVDRCIRNLTLIGSEGMNETDKLVLQIMTNKC
jgi:L-cysteine desulfidase